MCNKKSVRLSNLNGEKKGLLVENHVADRKTSKITRYTEIYSPSLRSEQ